MLNTVKHASLRTTERAHSGNTHRSLERGLSALELVAAANQALPSAEIARRLGLHRSTAHHLLQSLVSLGWLRQDEESRGYSLSSRPYELTGHRWSVARIGELAQPLLERLTRETAEGSSVAAWQNGIVTIAAKHEADGPVRVVQQLGGQRPVYCTAVGKAIAAWLPRAEMIAALARQPMEALTAKTITTPEAFEQELRRIRNAGYAIDDEEQFEGLRCIAMPVFSHSGEITGSMCVVGSKHRLTHQKLAAVRAPLAALSRELSQQLGHSPTSRK